MKHHTEFPVTDEDEAYEIRDLGTFMFEGIRLKVEIEAFREFDDDENPIGPPDYSDAELHLTCADAEHDLSHLIRDESLRLALQEFMSKTLEDGSNVTWGESGAQSSAALTFGRNGW